jgi:hypothetical protein
MSSAPRSRTPRTPRLPDSQSDSKPGPTHSDVRSAYAAKLADVSANSYDFSNLKIHLKPQKLSKHMFAGQNGVGHVALEFLAHVPPRVSADDSAYSWPHPVEELASDCSDSEL